MSEQVLSLERLTALIEEKRPTCGYCDTVLRGSGLDLWGPHDGGYWVEGYREKQWVFVHCECGYDTSLHKIWRELA